MTRYRIIYRKQDLSYRMSSLYSQNQFSIGILDSQEKSDLDRTIDWYSHFLNLSLIVLTTESRVENYEELIALYPNVSFIVFKTDTTTGEYINIMANECYSEYFLIVRTDMDLVAFDSKKLLDVMNLSSHPVVIQPLFVNEKAEVLPSIRIPFLSGKEVEPKVANPNLNSEKPEKTLYPIMGLGLYNRALFQRLRGYDEEIYSEYYQTLDLGVRCHLFGNTLVSSSFLAFQFLSRNKIMEDKSECEGMNRFYTKALSVKCIAGKNMVSKWKPYCDKEIYKEEVKKKQVVLQKTDFFNLIEKW